jgi:hypothetical protein
MGVGIIVLSPRVCGAIVVDGTLMVRDAMPWGLTGPAIMPLGFMGEGLLHQRAWYPRLGLEHRIIRHNRSQISLMLRVEATGVAGDRLPEVVARLEERVLPLAGSQACCKMRCPSPLDVCQCTVL